MKLWHLILPLLAGCTLGIALSLPVMPPRQLAQLYFVPGGYGVYPTYGVPAYSGVPYGIYAPYGYGYGGYGGYGGYRRYSYPSGYGYGMGAY